LIHAHDVARAAIAAATTDIGPGAHILNLNGPEVVTWNEYIERLGDQLDVPDRSTQSMVRFRLMAATAEVLRRFARSKRIRTYYRKSRGVAQSAMTGAKGVTALYPSSSELQLLSRKVHYVAERATQTLGFSPEVSLDDGIRQSVAWCKLHGIVQAYGSK
jgi:nucleoside-diphosphate-sugar epimerase